MSAVSKKVTPASRAAVITARLAARSIFMPKLLHPRPTRVAASPDVPSGRFSITSFLLLTVVFANRPRLPRSPLQFDGEGCPAEAGTGGVSEDGAEPSVAAAAAGFDSRAKNRYLRRHARCAFRHFPLWRCGAGRGRGRPRARRGRRYRRL